MSKLLLIVPRQYGYEKIIRKNLEELGNTVYTLHHPNTKSFLYWLLATLNRSLFLRWRRREEEKVLKNLKFYSFDVVYAIHGYQYSQDFYRALKDMGVKEFIAYTWDSIRANEFGRNVHQYKDIFDKIYTFDPGDASKYDLHYLPLFFSVVSEGKIEGDGYLLFIGSLLTKRRYEYFKKIKRYCLSNDIEFKYHLRVSYRFFVKELLKGNVLRDVSFYNMNYGRYLDLTKKARAIIDLPGQEQAGLTMRCIEVIALKKRLITFNSTIETLGISQDSYTLVNIDDIDIDLKTDYIPSDITHLYIKNWLNNQIENF